MDFIFPEYLPNNNINISDQIDNLKEEIEEFLNEADLNKQDIEIIDIFHSAETLVRKYFKNDKLKIDSAIVEVFDKNYERGYYR